MKIAITRKDAGVKEIECDWFRFHDGALSVGVVGYRKNVEQTIYACTDWLDVEVVDEAEAKDMKFVPKYIELFKPDDTE